MSQLEWQRQHQSVRAGERVAPARLRPPPTAPRPSVPPSRGKVALPPPSMALDGTGKLTFSSRTS